MKILDKLERIEKRLNYRKIVKFFLISIAVIVVFSCADNIAYASGVMGYDGNDSPFEKVTSGWGQFMADKYRSNYYLDTGDVGTFDIVDKGLNALANVFFWLVTMICWVGVNVFNFCINNNIVDAFAKVLDTISKALVDGVFDKMYLIMFMFSLISVCYYYAKRNFAAIVAHFGAFMLIIALSILVTNSSAKNFVVDTTKFSKDIGVDIITSMNAGDAEKSNENSEMLGTLWANLVQKPWTIIEFDGQKAISGDGVDDSIKISQEILSKSDDSDEREEITDKEVVNINFASRLATTFILGIISLIKVTILILVGVIQIFFQISAIAIVMIVPLFLLLAIVPYFGGLNLLKFIGEKYIGVQFGIVLTSFVVGVLLMIDNVTLTFFMNIGANFTVSLLIQAVCWALIVVFRHRIIDSLARLQERISPGTSSSIRDAVDSVRKGGETAANGARLANERTRYMRTAAGGKTKILAAKATGGIIDKAYKKYSDARFKNNKSKPEDIPKNGEENKNANSTKQGTTKGANRNQNIKAVPLDFSKVNRAAAASNLEGNSVEERLNRAREEGVEGVELYNTGVDTEEVNPNNTEDRLNGEREQQLEGVELQEDAPVYNNSENSENEQNEEMNLNNTEDRLEEEREQQLEGVEFPKDAAIEKNKAQIEDSLNDNTEDRLNEQREQQDEGVDVQRDILTNSNRPASDNSKIPGDSITNDADNKLDEEREHQNEGVEFKEDNLNNGKDIQKSVFEPKKEAAADKSKSSAPLENENINTNKAEDKLEVERERQNDGTDLPNDNARDLNKDIVGVLNKPIVNNQIKENKDINSSPDIKTKVSDAAASAEKAVKTNKINGNNKNSSRERSTERIIRPSVEENRQERTEKVREKAQDVRRDQENKKQSSKSKQEANNQKRAKAQQEANSKQTNRTEDKQKTVRVKKSEAQKKSEARVRKLKKMLGVNKTQIKGKERELNGKLKQIKSEQKRKEFMRNTIRKNMR